MLQLFTPSRNFSHRHVGFFSIGEQDCVRHWKFLKTTHRETTPSQFTRKAVMEPAERNVGHHGGWRKNTTMDCGVVALRLEFFSRSFFRFTHRTWLPRHWTRSDTDNRCPRRSGVIEGNDSAHLATWTQVARWKSSFDRVDKHVISHLHLTAQQKLATWFIGPLSVRFSDVRSQGERLVTIPCPAFDGCHLRAVE